jgi:TPR repeat protein
MDQIGIEDMFNLGVDYFSQVHNNLNQYTAKKTDYSKALIYLKKAAEKYHIKGSLQPEILHDSGHGATKNGPQEKIDFYIARHTHIKAMGYIAVGYHAYEGAQNFSKAYQWYRQLEIKSKEFSYYL